MIELVLYVLLLDFDELKLVLQLFHFQVEVFLLLLFLMHRCRSRFISYTVDFHSFDCFFVFFFTYFENL